MPPNFTERDQNTQENSMDFGYGFDYEFENETSSLQEESIPWGDHKMGVLWICPSIRRNQSAGVRISTKLAF
ncbi:hypothetical protein [Absidia glauca]|uniref:Uncharacterized protein n=1 Tax=Absidia glauca TaxID=4829 RepID=A0A168KTW1_ABSGL|nr:hypothetical protein [Absidia glauca]